MYTVDKCCSWNDIRDKMATSRCKFPLPVTFDDDTDFCRIVLTIDEMTVRKPLFRKPQATNAVIAASFVDGVVEVDVVVNDNQVRYLYRKPLPYDVIADKCKTDVMNGNPPKISVVLAKATRQSWAAQKKYFISPSGK